MSIWIKALHHISSEKCKLKQQDTTAHVSEWPKSRTLTTLHASEHVQKQEFLFIDSENVRWYNDIGRQFAGFL